MVVFRGWPVIGVWTYLQFGYGEHNSARNYYVRHSIYRVYPRLLSVQALYSTIYRTSFKWHYKWQQLTHFEQSQILPPQSSSLWIFSASGFVMSNFATILISHDFAWLFLAACILLWWSLILRELWKPHADRSAVGALDICQSCGGFCFASNTRSADGCLLQISRRSPLKSL
jgi:hypothetical protein